MNQSANNSRASSAESWFVATENGAVEYSLEALKNEIARGNVHSASLVWRKGMQDWVQLDQVPLLRMLASVQPRREIGNPTDFAAMAAPVAAGLFDEQFDDETTLFRPPGDTGAESSASQHRSGTSQPSLLANCSAETPVADQPTAIFDGLFDTPDGGAAGADAQPNATLAQESGSPDRGLNLGEPALNSDTTRQPESVARVDDSEPPKTGSTVDVSDAQRKGGRAPVRRNQPPSVSRKQKSDRPQSARPALARPTTPRVSIAAISSRAIESRPNFQLPKREPIPVGFAPRAPMTTGAMQQPALTHSPPIVAIAQAAPPMEMSSVRVELPMAAPGARHTAPAMLAPIVLPVPMPALPPPPPRMALTKSTQSEPRTCAADETEHASAAHGSPEPENQRPVTVARSGEGSSPASAASVAAVDMPSARTGTQSEGERTSTPGIEGIPSVQAEQLEHWFDRAPTANVAEGDSLFPSSSSIHPGLFRANKSRRAILLLASCGVAAAATFGIVLAVRSPEVVSTPHSATENLREQPSLKEPVTRQTSGQTQAPSNSAREPAEAQRKDSEQRRAIRVGVVATRESSEATRPPSSAAVRRNKATSTTGAVAIAHSESPESGPPAADESQAWERGTVEKRAWMQPGF